MMTDLVEKVARENARANGFDPNEKKFGVAAWQWPEHLDAAKNAVRIIAADIAENFTPDFDNELRDQDQLADAIRALGNRVRASRHSLYEGEEK
jgi:hypothetical protein